MIIVHFHCILQVLEKSILTTVQHMHPRFFLKLLGNRDFILKVSARSPIILMLCGVTVVREAGRRESERRERQREMAERLEQWSRSGASLESGLRWSWSSRGVCAVERESRPRKSPVTALQPGLTADCVADTVFGCPSWKQFHCLNIS